MDDFNEFSQQYLQHLDWLEVPHPPTETLKLIHELFLFVSHNGGWAYLTGLNTWSSFSSLPDARKFFESNFLVSFERSQKQNWPYSKETTKNINFSLLMPMPIYTNAKKKDWNSFLAEDLAIFRDVYQLGVDKSLLSLESIQKKYGNIEIRVISQESDPAGFSIKTPYKEKMSLAEYIGLMHSMKPDRGLIKFAVNIDIGQWHDEIDELRKKLPSVVLWGSKDDTLRYSRQHICGMTLPQLYLKVKGCWTGGHEENLRFMSANINHGESACEWWGLDPHENTNFRDCVKQEKKFDIYNSETLWWPDEIFCLIKGFKVYHSIQQPGDLVIVGPGAIHWVKSLGRTVNSAWNFGSKRLINFKRSYEREKINKSINFRSIVPMNLLALDLLNHELSSLDIELVDYLKKQIIGKAKEEKNIIDLAKVKKTEVNNIDNVIHCENCYLELFRIYFRCEKCVKNRLNGGKKICFFCFLCIKNVHLKVCKGKVVMVERFLESDFEKFVAVVDRRIKGDDVQAMMQELMYDSDKNIEENVYVSQFNGIEFDDGEEEVKEDKGEVEVENFKRKGRKVQKSKKNEEIKVKTEEKEEKNQEIGVNIGRSKEGKVKMEQKEKEIEGIKVKNEEIDGKKGRSKERNRKKLEKKGNESMQTFTKMLKNKKSNPKLKLEPKSSPPPAITPEKTDKNPHKTLKGLQNFIKALPKPEISNHFEISQVHSLSIQATRNTVIESNSPITNSPKLEVTKPAPALNIKFTPISDPSPSQPFLPLKRPRTTLIYAPVIDFIPKKPKF